MGDLLRGLARGNCCRRLLPLARAQKSDFLQHAVQAEARDELHDVIMRAPMMADAEDGNDVGVVQPGSRLGLALEAQQLLGVVEGVRWQHLQRHAPAQRHLLGLEDDAHAALADLAQDTVIAELTDRQTAPEVRPRGSRRVVAQVFQQQQGGEQLADIGGEVGIVIGVLR